ncbi:MAG: DUF948 domain-containing protein [Patescibacteria group bacterium]
MLEIGKTILFFALSLAILSVSGYFCYLLFNWAKLMQETKRTVEDLNKKLAKVDPVLDEASGTATDLLQTVREIDKNFLKPIASFSRVVKKIKNITGIFSGGEEEEEE